MFVIPTLVRLEHDLVTVLEILSKLCCVVACEADKSRHCKDLEKSKSFCKHPSITSSKDIYFNTCSKHVLLSPVSDNRASIPALFTAQCIN